MRRLACLALSVFIGLGLLAGLLLWPAGSQAQSTTRQVTVLSSAARITSTNSSDVFSLGENLNTRGGYVVLNVAGVSGSARITPTIQGKDPISGNYFNLLAASAGVTGAGTYVYLVYPGAGSAAAGVTQVAGFPLPVVWRVSVSHATTDTITYSVAALPVQ